MLSLKLTSALHFDESRRPGAIEVRGLIITFKREDHVYIVFGVMLGSCVGLIYNSGVGWGSIDSRCEGWVAPRCVCRSGIWIDISSRVLLVPICAYGATYD